MGDVEGCGVGLLDATGLSVGRGDGSELGGPGVGELDPAASGFAAGEGAGAPLFVVVVTNDGLPASGGAVGTSDGSAVRMSTASFLGCLPRPPPTGAGAGPANTGPNPGMDRCNASAGSTSDNATVATYNHASAPTVTNITRAQPARRPEGSTNTGVPAGSGAVTRTFLSGRSLSGSNLKTAA